MVSVSFRPLRRRPHLKLEGVPQKLDVWPVKPT